MILVSACLLGLDCRYDGGDNKIEELLEFLSDKNYLPVCPEQMGGLTTPRDPAEITVASERKVITNSGEDVTSQFLKGAHETLKLKNLTGASYAILKARSPSCGSKQIYDGSFTKVLIQGQGLTSELLRQHDVKVYNENNYKEINWGL